MSKKDSSEKIKTCFSREKTFKEYNIYLSEEIGDCDQYTDIFNIFRTANEEDHINLIINSPGGQVWTAMQFLFAMSQCQCEITGIIDGIAHSAASLIFLNCDSFSVPELSLMMVHNYTGGNIGKGHELKQWIEGSNTHIENIFRRAYKYFLTKKEIDQLINGKDFWFSGDEILGRLDKKMKKEKKKAKKKRKQQEQLEQQEQQEQQEQE